MRWTMPRPTVRALLVLVALLAGAMGAGRWWAHRRASCLERAAHHRLWIWHWDANHVVVLPYIRGRPIRVPSRADRPYEEVLASQDPHYARHLGLARRFERAASRPWLPIPVEPPEPGHLLSD